MNPVNDFPNNKPWHPLDFQFFTFEGGVSNEVFKNYNFFYYLVLRVQTENQKIFTSAVFLEIILMKLF